MPLKFPRKSPHPVIPRASTRGVASLAAAAVGAGMLMTASTAAAAPQLTGLLSVGAKGDQVSEVQHALHLKRSGHYDNGTRKAVVRFQDRKHLMVDGVVGPQTWDTLFHISAPAPAPVASTPTTTTPTSSASSGYSIPAGVVQCESGGNWSAVNSSSGAGGAYQILPSTWAAYGGTGSPQDASPAEQSAIAAKIYATQGPSAWTC